jgi:hypothetical protein
MKVNGTIDKYKVRLVIKGFKQQEDVNYFDTLISVRNNFHINVNNYFNN